MDTPYSQEHNATNTTLKHLPMSALGIYMTVIVKMIFQILCGPRNRSKRLCHYMDTPWTLPWTHPLILARTLGNEFLCLVASFLKSRGHTSDFLLAQVMRFFQILSRRQPERVATRVTNSSEFGDKLKAS